jgi:hypothetical protein
MNNHNEGLVQALIMVCAGLLIGLMVVTMFPTYSSITASGRDNIHSRCNRVLHMVRTEADSAQIYVLFSECVPPKPTVTFKNNHYELVPDTSK